jgi:uncharacterized protein YecE (DUF72 family)
MDYRIGCSGYYYPGWKNDFYPAGTASRNWLAYYSTIFNTVELNGTFYRLPKLGTLKRYADVTPEDFTFSVKISRYITHVKRLRESRQTIADFTGLVQEGLGSKLACLLFQFPATFRYSEENLALILESVPHTQMNVIEFRHSSWWIEDVRVSFENNDLTFCNVDYPGLETIFFHTSTTFYLRLHGKPELFKSPYTVHQLEEFRSEFPSNSKHVHVYFNNTSLDAAYTNAKQLIEIISSL